MQLTQIAYNQFPDEARYWALDKMQLHQINLIVGKNASGKSRALNIINGLANHLSGRSPVMPNSMNYDATFSGNGIEWNYQLKVHNKLVIFERLAKGSDLLLERSTNGEGVIFSEEQQAMLKFQSPQSALAVFARQDSVQHSYLAELIEWANGTFYYPFGKDFGQTSFAAKAANAPPPNLYDANHTTGVFMKGEKEFGDKYHDAIVEDMRAVGYGISEIGVGAPTTVEVLSPIPIPLSISCLYVQENNLQSRTEQIDMSQGMFRALSIFIHLNYGLLSGAYGCVIIDDIGEGLDFDRSTSIIKTIVDKIEVTRHQLLMTSNDRFVMNSVPLKYWSVLDRKGPTVHVFNQNNARERFEEFKFTGLSNFDFLATDFLHEPTEN